MSYIPLRDSPHEFIITIGPVRKRDMVNLFGQERFVDDGQTRTLHFHFENKMMWEDLAVALNQQPSKSQARKNGWSGEIPWGFSEYKRKFHKLFIFNLDPSDPKTAALNAEPEEVIVKPLPSSRIINRIVVYNDIVSGRLPYHIANVYDDNRTEITLARFETAREAYDFVNHKLPKDLDSHRDLLEMAQQINEMGRLISIKAMTTSFFKYDGNIYDIMRYRLDYNGLTLISLLTKKEE